MSAARYTWMDSALCAQADPELWTSEIGGNSRATKRICGNCPVTRECGAHADTLRRYDGLAMDGVWGGRSKRQRDNDRRRMGEAA